MAQPTLPLYPVDVTAINDGVWNEPVELSHPYPYRFELGEIVWIRASDGVWYPGKVVHEGMAATTKLNVPGLFFRVEFRLGGLGGPNVRKWFAPLNGEIKPDTEQTHQWLMEAGYLWPGAMNHN